MTYDVMQWIRKVKVRFKVYFGIKKIYVVMKVDSWQHKVEMELQRGVWCGYQNYWTTDDAKISYDKLLHFTTNMNNPGIGLDTQSGKNSC